MMRLNKLNLTRPEYGDNKGRLLGAVEFMDEAKGKIELPLDERLSKEIVALCADAIIRVTTAVANEITAEVLTITDEQTLIGEMENE